MTMVKNQTDMAEFVGGQLVPPDGEFHQVKDGDDVREAIRVGTLTEKRQSSRSRSSSGSSDDEPAGSSASSSGDDNDNGGDDS
jgi:hypothetical protein